MAISSVSARALKPNATVLLGGLDLGADSACCESLLTLMVSLDSLQQQKVVEEGVLYVPSPRLLGESIQECRDV